MMHINWAAIGKLAFSLVGLILPQVHTVETVAKALPSLHGKDKENAAVELVKLALGDATVVAHRHLLDEKDVEDATRKLIEAYVALQNVIARKNLAEAQPSNIIVPQFGGVVKSN